MKDGYVSRDAPDKPTEYVTMRQWEIHVRRALRSSGPTKRVMIESVACSLIVQRYPHGGMEVLKGWREAFVIVRTATC